MRTTLHKYTILCLHCGLLLLRNKLATDPSIPNINLVSSREISQTHQTESAHAKGLEVTYFSILANNSKQLSEGKYDSCFEHKTSN